MALGGNTNQERGVRQREEAKGRMNTHGPIIYHPKLEKWLQLKRLN
jgi:hypothetical protein